MWQLHAHDLSPLSQSAPGLWARFLRPSVKRLVGRTGFEPATRDPQSDFSHLLKLVAGGWPQYCLPESFTAGEFRDRRGRPSALRVSGQGKRAFSGRLLLLIDQGTGSGAEVFAATVKDARRGRPIGRNTRGQVLLAKDDDLGYGYSATIAHHDCFTSAGLRMEGRGVRPDEQVSLRIDDFRHGRDADLMRARERIGAQGGP